MPEGLLTTIYLSAAVLFILSLGGLSRQETARRGNLFGMIGMLLAIAATAAAVFGAFGPRWSIAVGTDGLIALLGAMLPAVLIGAGLAARVAMTSMPELVAILHSFVGLAAVLVGFSSSIAPGVAVLPGEEMIHDTEIYLAILVGAFTFTGSVVAFLKLRGSVSGKPLLLPGRHAMNIAMAMACLYLGYEFLVVGAHDGLTQLMAMTAISSVLGIHMVMSIGGADMPVVVSMLNSYSGWAAAAAGFMLNNDALIVTGALVGSSGAILSYIMCKAMNRSFVSVILGGFGGESSSAKRTDTGPQGSVTEVDVDETIDLLRDASSVVIVPGYGMAVAQAQHSLAEVVRHLRSAKKNVRFAIHPVAGRLPGHMNVLLAEANVPYDIVLEMDEINEDFPQTDVVMVIGANDIVNPSAEDDPTSPIAGMPVLKVWDSETTVVMKRGMASGYAGVENPLFFREKTRMLFGDAKSNVDAILSGLRK